MQRFREIDGSAARKIDRSMASLASIGSFEELETRFLEEAFKILPGDLLCWNNWERDLSGPISFRMNRDYAVRCDSLLEVFRETVSNHPVLAANQFGATTGRVMRISDFQSVAGFRENPLFREVYRHVDSHYQIMFTTNVLKDRRITLTWSRRAFDFSERERQVFHFMGLRLGVVSRMLDERERLEKNWRALCGFVDARLPAGPASALGERDVVLLTELMKGDTPETIACHLGTRRDSVDKRLGAIRERLGLENRHQLLSAMAELKSTVG